MFATASTSTRSDNPRRLTAYPGTVPTDLAIFSSKPQTSHMLMNPQIFIKLFLHKQILSLIIFAVTVQIPSFLKKMKTDILTIDH